jgi:hypothetical protein
MRRGWSSSTASYETGLLANDALDGRPRNLPSWQSLMHLLNVLSMRSRCWLQPNVRAFSAALFAVKRARESVSDR